MSGKFKNLKTDSLPSHWSADFFGNLVDYKLGKTPPRASSVYWKEGKYPWVSISDMTPHGVVTETAEKVSQKAYDAVFRGKLVPKGSLLMSFKLTIGRMSRLGIPAFHNEAIISFKPDPEKLSDDFIRYYLSQINYKDYQDTAIKGQTLNKGKLSALEIALPPLPEQKKIAHILSTVQRAIEAQERIIQTTTELKKALMHKLFTEGLRNEPQKQTEVGPVPESWEVVPLGKYARVLNGYAFKSADYIPDGVRLIRISNVSPGVLIDKDDKYLPTSYLKERSAYALKAGDLILSLTRPIIKEGMKYCFIEEQHLPALLNQRVGRFEITDPRLRKDYLFQIIFSPYFIAPLKYMAEGSNQPNVSPTRLEAFQIPIPTDMEEQKQIAELLTGLNRKMELAKQKVSQLQDLFRTLLHELMTAKTRVHKLEITA